MKKFLISSNKNWLELHSDAVERFKHAMIDADSYNDFDYIAHEQHPSEFRMIIDDFDTRLSKKLDTLINYFTFGKSKILYVVGARDSGKTCFSFWLAEQLYNKNHRMRIAYVGVKIKQGVLPEWCANYDDINKVPDGSFALVDEMALQYNARHYQSEENIQLGQLLAIARHKNLSIILITQDPNMGEINAWRLKDMIVYKRSNTYELPDRDNRKASELFKFWRYIKSWLKPTKQEQALFEYQAMNKVMLFTYKLPTFWSEGLSKAFNVVKFVTTQAPIKKKRSKSEGLLD